jgi:threonine/homoserine/homoserine lactone efflux protein
MTEMVAFTGHYPALLIVAGTLLMPGPTNTLFAVSGATANLKQALRLIPVAIVAYAISVTVLVTVATPLIDAAPAFEKLLRLAVSGVLLHAAFRLWWQPAMAFGTKIGQQTTVASSHIFLTTLLNPKALVLAMFVMPEHGSPASANVMSWAALLPFVIAMTSACWIAIGAVLKSQLATTATAGLIERCGAAVLIGFAGLVAASVFK